MKCRVCNSTKLELVFDLGMQPWGNNFLKKNQLGKEKFYPLELVYCNSCYLSQLSYTVKKEIMFSNHTYLSGMTSSLSNHFKSISHYIDENFNKKKNKKNILDIGSNDGVCLKHFKNLGYKVLGVESSKNISKIANKNHIKTLNAFYNFKVAKEINTKFDFINASGVFFHLEELHSVTKGIKFNLKDDGVFIVQFLYMGQIMKNVAFDQIYHEHLLYYNLITLQNLLDMHDLEIFDAYLTDIHGGQMVALVSHKQKYNLTARYLRLILNEKKWGYNKKKTYITFSDNAKTLKENNLKFIDNALKKKKLIYGLGAPVKGNTLLNYFGINKTMIPKLLEINNLRKNLYAPGSHIPIILEKEETKKPDIFYVLAWNFKKEILSKNKDLIKKGVQFYFPINIKK